MQMSAPDSHDIHRIGCRGGARGSEILMFNKFGAMLNPSLSNYRLVRVDYLGIQLMEWSVWDSPEQHKLNWLSW
jgi:hypothetical protein